MEGTELKSRNEEEMWLVKHLERIKRATVEDLKIGRELSYRVVSIYTISFKSEFTS